MEGMFTDMRLSEDIMAAFRRTRADREVAHRHGAVAACRVITPVGRILAPGEEMGSFSQDAPPALDLTVTVLTHTHWPIALTIVPCRLPDEVVAAFDVFKAYYLQRYSGRKLQFHPNMGTADMRANFPKRRHDLQVPTAMMALLMLFNERDVYSYTVRSRLFALVCFRGRVTEG